VIVWPPAITVSAALGMIEAGDIVDASWRIGGTGRAATPAARGGDELWRR
jgi:hypothetical protein